MSPVKRWGSPCLFPLQLFSLCWVLSVAQSKTVRYSTFEEDAPGTVIGTLAEDLHMKVSGDTSFRLMKQFNSSLLRVREGDGQLTVGDAGLDRERLCGQAPQCVLAFDVVSFSQEQFRLVHVEVEVRDVNDHAPRFPRAQIPVEVSESAPVGTRIPLEVPVDEDVGANGLQSVRLAEPHSPFRVELQTRADGAQCADLVLLQELDRESQASYSLELVAQDGGRPPRSATAALSVRVLDANDHSPAFPQGAVAEVELAEDAPVGSLLLDLDAADPDEGPNGDVVFTFGARTPPEARHLFRLDPRSGRLTLAGQVDYERQDTYELDVRAQDRGPGPRTATCKVIVRIRDVNDNAPDISITPLAAPGAPAASPFAAAAAAAALGGADTASSAGPGTQEAGATSLVPEGAARESLVALVSTSDRDSGANGQGRCALYGHEHFRLQPAYAGSSLVVTAASLDRERFAEYSLTLVAEARGAPPLRTVRPYTVRVGDENDHAPLFTKPVYEVSVRENNPPGAYLATVAARAPDLGRNGQVTYRLVEAEVGRSGEAVSTYVSVDPATGAIYALRSFDYETLRQLDVRIQASDGGSPQLSSNALVQVRVLDQNDHAPILVHPAPANGSLEVAVPGRTAKDTAVARIQARDADEGSNGELAFDLLQQEPREAFAIGRRTGEIPYGASPGFGKEPAPPVAVWKGHSFNTISGREAEKFSGKDSGKGDSDFNDSDSDISGDALKKDLINHMQSGLWACTAECKILGHSDRCWSPSCAGPSAHPPPHPPAQMSTFCKSTSLPRDPLRRDNYYQAQLPKTVGLQSVYEKVLHRDYDRTVTLLSPPRPGRLPDLQEIGVPLYESPPGGRYVSPKKGANENV
ncbi:Protocadherin-8 [Cricetulus griseus]|uniref:Protocadherin-8 n=1 Tax=Cricetulus griseus TaxID=10029 RepID=G3I8C7_CRIGR|nr:Protocadherin-8 [Cricetulus griseus]